MIKSVLLDLDGTLFIGNTPIAGAIETVEWLRQNSISPIFMSNANTLSREGMVEKLAKLGITAKVNEVYNTAYGSAKYIKEKFGEEATVYAIGEEGTFEELEKIHSTITERRPKVVVVGLDRKINYEKITIAYRAIKNGAAFLAMNEDNEYPTEEGMMPGSGAIVAAVKKASGVTPTVIGKPETLLIDLALGEHKLKKEEALIVGDRLDTDIEAAKRVGVKSVLVLTGVSKKEDIKEEMKPDFVIKSIKELPELLHKIV